ncbi:DNA repair protein RadC [Paenibacillus sp. LMG 31458]|uniref:DNA repair protein RadC n=2 Tax=Paenibacillus TaxID=44249 RepID=A0ABX1ZGI4_9BACL|nr:MULTISPECIES: DNA repair protein RadC [Paenibacillus]NOU73370.1 DNA repair protein RadC [Paenibacillus phytorum]NOU91025.1 DNA repair protein RadC [Paenibacillus germinis]
MEVTSLMLREVPQEERPRERMLQYGAGALSHAELLAILLRTGTVSESALRLAGRILSESGGLRSLVDMSKDQLTQIKGIGDAKALQIQAGIELGRRLAKSTFEERVTIRSPKDIADLVSEDLRYLQKEHFVCLFLNTKNHLLAQETLSMGSLNASIVHPREVFRAAIKRSSASIICVHNHPSGDPTPSPEDIQLTHRLMEAGTIIGIEVLDHVIIGDQRFISLKEQGFM